MQESHAREVIPVFAAALCLVILAYAGCGSLGDPPPSPAPPTIREACTQPSYDSSTPFLPREKHAFIVMLENHTYETVLNNPNMPFLNKLAQRYAYAQGYFASSHPSLPNYLVLTTGLKITDSDGFTSTVTDDNIARHLIQSGMSWKEYSEALPSVGYDGPDVSPYIEHHNPLSYFSDVRNDPAQLQNLAPLSQLFSDVNAHTLPNYAFIVPDNTDDAHSCDLSVPNCSDSQRLADADTWLSHNISPLIYSTDVNQPGGGVVIIAFDESLGIDLRGFGDAHGGHVMWVVAGADVKPGFASTTCYDHSSTLHFMSQALGLTNAPAAAGTAADMREFLVGN